MYRLGDALRFVTRSFCAVPLSSCTVSKVKDENLDVGPDITVISKFGSNPRKQKSATGEINRLTSVIAAMKLFHDRNLIFFYIINVHQT
jgi:hypothetical protein